MCYFSTGVLVVALLLLLLRLLLLLHAPVHMRPSERRHHRITGNGSGHCCVKGTNARNISGCVNVNVINITIDRGEGIIEAAAGIALDTRHGNCYLSITYLRDSC